MWETNKMATGESDVSSPRKRRKKNVIDSFMPASASDELKEKVKQEAFPQGFSFDPSLPMSVDYQWIAWQNQQKQKLKMYDRPWEEDPAWSSYSSQEREEKLKRNITALERLKADYESKQSRAEQDKADLLQRLSQSDPTEEERLLRRVEEKERLIKLCERAVKGWQELISAHQQQLGHEHEAAAAAAAAMNEGVIEVQQMNIAVLGAGGAGKTSMLSALVGKKPPALYTSTDVCSSGTRVASVESPSDFVRAASTGNRVLLPCGSLTPDCFTWLLGNTNLLHLTACGANASLDQVKARRAASRLPSPPATHLRSKRSSAQSGGVSSPIPPPVVPSNHAHIHAVAKDVLSQATELMKRPTSEPLAKVRIINFIDSGGQLQFSEIFRTFNAGINGGIFVLDASKDFEANIEDQFFVDGNPIGKPYKSQFTYELLFKRSVQALQQCEESCFSVVVTHPDQLKPSDLPVRIRDINEWVQSVLESTDMKDNVIFNENLRDILFVVRADNPSEKERESIRKLLQKLCDMFANKSLVQVHKIPLQQFLLEQAMRKLGEGRNGVLNIEECREVARAINMPVESVDKALRYLRSCSLILYFPELDCLKGVVFCEIQTLFSIITLLVQYSAKLRGECPLASIPTPNIGSGKCTTDFATQGIISEELLAMDTFASCFNPDFSAAQYLQLMNHLEITGLVDPPTRQYVMPCILPEMSCEDLEKYRVVSASVNPLLLYFGKWPQSGIFCSLIARLGSLYKWVPQPFRNLVPPRLYRNCMKLIPSNLPCTVTLIESYDCGYFEVHVRPLSQDDSREVGPEVKRVLREALHRTPPKDSFSCGSDQCNLDQSPCKYPAVVTFETKKHKTTRYLRCTSSGEVSQFTASHACWYEECATESQVITLDDIAALMEVLVELAGSWELFIQQLGVSAGVVEHIKLENAQKPDFPKLCLQSGLGLWVLSNDQPTYQQICSVLCGNTITNVPLARRVEQLATAKLQGL